MKSLKFLSVLALLMVLFIGNADAQGTRTKAKLKEGPKMMMMELTPEIIKAVKIKKKQLPKIKAINGDFMNKMSALRQSSGGDRMAMKNGIKAARDARNLALSDVLKKKQLKKFMQLERQFRQNNRPADAMMGGTKKGITKPGN